MSYQEKNASVMLFSALIIAAYYIINLLRMTQGGAELNPAEVYTLWGVIIVASILANIASSILTNIVFGIIETIRTNEEPELFMDERDKMIELTGNRNAYNVFGIGAFFSMLSLVVGMEPLVMFNILVASGIAAQITESLTQLYLYRRGF